MCGASWVSGMLRESDAASPCCRLSTTRRMLATRFAISAWREGGGAGGGAWLGQSGGFVSWKRLQVFILTKQQLTSPTYLNSLIVFLFSTICKQSTTSSTITARQEASIQTLLLCAPLAEGRVTEQYSVCRIPLCLQRPTSSERNYSLNIMPLSFS